MKHVRADIIFAMVVLQRKPCKKQCCLFCCFCCLDNLLIDYQFTFSLLQEDDRHYTAINFMATPEQVLCFIYVIFQFFKNMKYVTYFF